MLQSEVDGVGGVEQDLHCAQWLEGRDAGLGVGALGGPAHQSRPELREGTVGYLALYPDLQPHGADCLSVFYGAGRGPDCEGHVDLEAIRVTGLVQQLPSQRRVVFEGQVGHPILLHPHFMSVPPLVVQRLTLTES